MSCCTFHSYSNKNGITRQCVAIKYTDDGNKNLGIYYRYISCGEREYYTTFDNPPKPENHQHIESCNGKYILVNMIDVCFHKQ